MRQLRFIMLYFSVFLFISQSSLFAATIWVAAEYFDDFVDDKGDDVEAFTFEGRDAITGGGVYFVFANVNLGMLKNLRLCWMFSV